MLAAGSVSQTPQIKAQEVERYRVKLLNRTATVCVNETVTYPVSIVIAQQVGMVPDNLARIPFRPGVAIAASNSNAAVGNLTRIGSPTLSNGADPGLFKTDTLPFIFEAKKVGETTLRFDAVVGGLPSEGDSIVVQVVDICNYKVTVFSWAYTVVGPGNTIGLLAIIDEADLIPVSQNVLRGNADVAWTPNIFIAGCGHMDSMLNSKADINGVMRERGQLVVDVIYHPASLSEAHCGPSGGSKNSISPDYLRVTIDQAGGVAIAPHKMSAGSRVIPGRAKVYVTRVKATGK